MVQGSRKSRTMRRVHRKVTSGSKVVYELRKPSRPICGNCGAVLNGVPHERPKAMQKLPKTQKRPQRPFGGVLCSRCHRDLVLLEARDNNE
ncbi:50S ribosomal protein L34e [Candidatus Woesearchaeota archaeon]|nr:50S ribosomal protein L34e [Candidatus Woesearchaeota archaeon]